MYKVPMKRKEVIIMSSIDDLIKQLTSLKNQEPAGKKDTLYVKVSKIESIVENNTKTITSVLDILVQMAEALKSIKSDTSVLSNVVVEKSKDEKKV